MNMLKINLSISLLSTWMTCQKHVKNMSNWPDPGDQMMDDPKLFTLTA